MTREDARGRVEGSCVVAVALTAALVERESRVQVHDAHEEGEECEPHAKLEVDARLEIGHVVEPSGAAAEDDGRADLHGVVLPVAHRATTDLVGHAMREGDGRVEVRVGDVLAHVREGRVEEAVVEAARGGGHLGSAPDEAAAHRRRRGRRVERGTTKGLAVAVVVAGGREESQDDARDAHRLGDVRTVACARPHDLHPPPHTHARAR